MQRHFVADRDHLAILDHDRADRHLAARRGVVFPLRTERLTLTPFAADDAPAVFDFCCLQEVWTWTSGRAGSAAELRESYLAAGDRLTVRAGEAIIGVGKLAVQDAWSQGGPREEARDAQAEIGWTIHPTHAGQGYATELAGALLKLAFTGLGVHRVEAEAFAEALADGVAEALPLAVAEAVALADAALYEAKADRSLRIVVRDPSGVVA